MATYTVTKLGPIEHDGKPYAEGDTVDLKPEVAAPLLAAGVVVESGAARRRAAAEKAEDAQPAAGG